MTPEQWSLVFGGLSTFLYICWAVFAFFTFQKHMAGALIFYAGANVFLMWPVIKLYL